MIKKCLKKDRKAQNELYKRCYQVLIPVCWRYSHSKDLAVSYFNAGFLKILINLKKYKTKVPFELWCRRVMVNAIIDEYRRSKNYRENIEVRSNDDMAKVQIPEERLSEKQEEMLELIKAKVRLLPPVTSKVFNLYAIDGYKHHEIATMLNISEGTSMWHYSVAKKKLKEMVGEDKQRKLANDRA